MGILVGFWIDIFYIVYANAGYISGAVTIDYSSFIYCKVQKNRYYADPSDNSPESQLNYPKLNCIGIKKVDAISVSDGHN